VKALDRAPLLPRERAAVRRRQRRKYLALEHAAKAKVRRNDSRGLPHPNLLPQAREGARRGLHHGKSAVERPREPFSRLPEKGFERHSREAKRRSNPGTLGDAWIASSPFGRLAMTLIASPASWRGGRRAPFWTPTYFYQPRKTLLPLAGEGGAKRRMRVSRGLCFRKNGLSSSRRLPHPDLLRAVVYARSKRRQPSMPRRSCGK
jgi:hypothetical protein